MFWEKKSHISKLSLIIYYSKISGLCIAVGDVTTGGGDDVILGGRGCEAVLDGGGGGGGGGEGHLIELSLVLSWDWIFLSTLLK